MALNPNGEVFKILSERFQAEAVAEQPPFSRRAVGAQKVKEGKSAVLSRSHQYNSEIAPRLSSENNNNDSWISMQSMRARHKWLQNPCCPVLSTAVFSVEWLSSLFLAALLAVCSCICAGIIFPLRLICACETSCFGLAHNGSSHGAVQVEQRGISHLAAC